MPAGHASGRFADVRRLTEVDSTNRLAADLAREGAADGVVVVAGHQTAGRGRFERRWEAPPGSSLLVSVIVRPVPPFGLAALALAAAGACADVAGVRPGLKWPNDLVVDATRKVGGLLGEVVDGAAVLGLGLNVNWGDATPPAGGISLDQVTGEPASVDAILAALLEGLEHLLSRPGDDLLAACRRGCVTLGRDVAVHLGSRTVTGRAVGIDDDGHLVVATAEGTETIAAGDVVHLR